MARYTAATGNGQRQYARDQNPSAPQDTKRLNQDQLSAPLRTSLSDGRPLWLRAAKRLCSSISALQRASALNRGLDGMSAPSFTSTQQTDLSGAKKLVETNCSRARHLIAQVLRRVPNSQRDLDHVTWLKLDIFLCDKALPASQLRS